MRLISASGKDADEIICGVADGLNSANIPYLAISTTLGKEFGCGRPFVGYAIDGDGEAAEGSAEVLLTSADRIPFFRGFSEGIIILSPDSFGAGCEFKRKGFVITSQDVNVPQKLRKYPLISCGMSSKNTVTFSSLRQDGGMICLQRRLCTLGGKIVEPQEFPVKRGGFSTLAIFTALLISDVII